MNTQQANQDQQAHLVAHRNVQARPAEVFELLCNPARHHQTEPGDWVQDAIDAELITHIDQIFGMQMYHVNAGGYYRMDNRVIALETNQTIAWEPGQYDDSGTRHAAGWTWRYDLADTDNGTEVTLTYDWSQVPEELRATFGLPPFKPEFLDESLASLDQALQSPET